MTVALGTVDGTKRITFARAKTSQAFAWHTCSDTLQNLLERSIYTGREGAKDGACITMGGLTGTRRTKRAVISEHILMLDHDTGMSIEDVVRRYKAEGLFAVVWATHSHGKSETLIAEGALLRWCAKNEIEVGVESACRYLKLVKNYEDRVFGDAAAGFEKIATDEGAKFRITHQPMDRSRSLVVLAEPFEFIADDVTQDERMKLWSEKYLGFAQHMGFHADQSCADPSRLMYLPSRPEGADEDDYPLYETPGGYLNLDKVETVARSAYQKDKFAAGIASLGGSSSEFKTPGLLRFVAKYGNTFRISDFFADYFPDEFRHVNGEKHVYQCPNDDEHSNAGDPEDVAFFCVDGEAERGFSAWCQHDGCISASGGDRVWYLDKACQNAKLSDCFVLEQYADEAVEEAQATEAAVEHRAGLTKQSTGLEIQEALRGVSKMHALDQGPALQDIKKQTGRDINSLRDALRGVQDEEPDGEVVPLDPKTYTGPIDITLPFDVLKECTKERIKQKNKDFPRLFTEVRSGMTIQIIDEIEDGGVRLARIVNGNDWAAYLSDTCDFVSGEGVSVPVPDKLVQVSTGRKDWRLNTLDRITTVPQLGGDHVIHYKEGYVPAMRCYLRPNVAFEPLPLPEADASVWEDEVEDAMHMLFKEAVRDFPFCDYGMDDRLRDIRSEEKDEDGHAYPNLQRGASSRSNFLAMVLQGFVRPAIDGVCPAYHIDKAAPGTGAGFLTDVVSYILTGKASHPIILGKSEEETQKVLTSELADHPQLTFLDNISGKLDSRSLAGVLTSGEWRGRILGSSNMVSLPVKTIWVIAGNNILFTEELRRRNVPINMDAKCDRPAADRVGAFKYEPLGSWLAANRSALVRACLVLIANWIRLGAKQGTKKMGTFDAWSMLMSGIMEATDAALGPRNEYQLSESFLSTMEAYEDNNADGERSDAIIHCLWARHNTEEFTTDEAFAVYLANEDTHDLSDLDPGHGETTQRKRVLSRKLTSMFKDRWTTFEDGTRVCLQKHGRRSTGSKFFMVVDRSNETSLS